MLRFVTTVLSCTLLLGAVTTSRAQDPNYILELAETVATTHSEVDVQITITNIGGSLLGLSFGLTTGTPLVDPLGATFGPAIQSLNGGAGPDFFQQGLAPLPGDVTGFYCGTVFSFLGTAPLAPGVHDAIHMHYVADTDAPASYQLCFTSAVGTPPSAVVVVVAGVSVVPVAECASFEVVLPIFKRGDTNASGAIDLADPIYLLSYLFVSGPSVCESAMDSNSDGALDLADALYLLLYINGLGPVPAAPFEICESAPSDFGCAESPACP